MRTNRALYSWAFYDFANTIFSAVVLTFHFPLYLTGFTHRNIHLGLATTGAMVLAGAAVPWLGRLSDQTGKTKQYLIVSTLFCIGFTALLSLFAGVPILMGVFLLASFAFHASLVFYNALLPVVADEKGQGFASGLGTGLGYLGVVISVPIAHIIAFSYGERYVFLTAAALFLLFSLPLFFWVPERTALASHPQKISKILGTVLGKPGLLLFFLGNFFVMEALNTVIFWLVIYMARVFNPAQSKLLYVFLGFNLSAFFFGLISGALTDRWGSRKTFLAAAAALFLTILGLALTNSFRLFAMGGLIGGGFSFAGIWTAGRKRLVELAPPDEVGSYFGLYNLTTKISVIFSLIFSVLADRFGFPTALLTLSIPSGVGVLFLLFAKNR